MFDDPKILRRDFLKNLSSLPFLFFNLNGQTSPFSWLSDNPRRSSSNPFVKGGKSILVVVEGRNLKKMLEAGFRALPGFEDVLRAKKRIVLKPNATAPEPYPVTTDINLLRELVSKIKRCSSSQITICDSSSYAGLTAHRVFSKLGYFDLGREKRIKVYSIDPTKGSYFMKVTSPSWKRNRSLLTNRIVQESDFVVNCAIPKRHHAADFTCALKNNFGCTYDTFRMLAHSTLSSKGDQTEFFDQSLVEFADAVRPELTIVDARSILAKSGPSFHSGKSEIKENVNRLILSGDMVAVDAYCADLMTQFDETFFKGKRVDRQLNYAKNMGLGEKDLKNIGIIEVEA
jgi:uncharacterized protein (DUF362 family)